MALERLEQEALLRLFGRGLGSLLQSLDVARNEVGLEFLAAGLEQGLGVEAGGILGHYRGDRILFARYPGLCRYAVDIDVVHLRHFGDGLLDESRVDEVAVAADAPTLAELEEQPAVL